MFVWGVFVRGGGYECIGVCAERKEERKKTNSTLSYPATSCMYATQSISVSVRIEGKVERRSSLMDGNKRQGNIHGTLRMIAMDRDASIRSKVIAIAHAMDTSLGLTSLERNWTALLGFFCRGMVLDYFPNSKYNLQLKFDQNTFSSLTTTSQTTSRKSHHLSLSAA